MSLSVLQSGYSYYILNLGVLDTSNLQIKFNFFQTQKAKQIFVHVFKFIENVLDNKKLNLNLNFDINYVLS